MEAIKETGPDLLELAIKKELGIELSPEEEITYLGMDSDVQSTLNCLVESEMFSNDINSTINKIFSKMNYSDEERINILNRWKEKKKEKNKSKNKIIVEE